MLLGSVFVMTELRAVDHQSEIWDHLNSTCISRLWSIDQGEKPMWTNINTIGFLRSFAITIFKYTSNSYQKMSKRNVILICHDGTVSRMQSIERSTSNATKFTGNTDTVFGSHILSLCVHIFFVPWFSNSRIIRCKRTICFVLFCLFCETRYG